MTNHETNAEVSTYLTNIFNPFDLLEYLAIERIDEIMNICVLMFVVEGLKNL